MLNHPVISRIDKKIGELAAGAVPGVPVPGLVVGLSGGPDSVLLLHAALRRADRTGAPVAAAHLNHGLRPGEADRDADFCRDLCSALGIEYFERTEDPRAGARARGGGLEEAGRHLRRRFLLGLIDEHPHLHVAATGHHRDDQAETVIMRLFRGTGPEGLRGIRPVHGRIIHPLLGVTRRQIVACLEECGQPWRTDSSNLAGDNLRARIRRELTPVLRGIFGSGSELVPARTADLLADDLDLLDKVTATALADVRSSEDREGLRVGSLLAMDRALARRVLRRWLKDRQPQGLERVHIDSTLEWLAQGQSGGSLDLPRGIMLRRDFDLLTATGGPEAGIALRDGRDYRILVTSNEAAGSGAGDDFGVGDPGDESTWSLTCPAEALRGNLQIRNWRPGDRFQPFGLDGTKKLSDLLREWRIPARDRDSILVVCDEDGLLWVVGRARAERTRLLPSTSLAVTISVAKRSSHPNQGNDNR